MNRPEDKLLSIADLYVAAVSGGRGRSLARVATIVANRGSFFEPIRQGRTCSVRNFARFVSFFAAPENWPDEVIPVPAKTALEPLIVALAEPTEVGRLAA